MQIGEQNQAAAVRAAQSALWRSVVCRFRELEHASALKQADLARRLGVSRPQIHEWLSDPQNMTIKAAGRLLLAMDSSLSCTAEVPDVTSKNERSADGPRLSNRRRGWLEEYERQS